MNNKAKKLMELRMQVELFTKQRDKLDDKIDTYYEAIDQLVEELENGKELEYNLV